MPKTPLENIELLLLPIIIYVNIHFNITIVLPQNLRVDSEETNRYSPIPLKVIYLWIEATTHDLLMDNTGYSGGGRPGLPLRQLEETS